MNIKNIYVENFRNLENQSLEFSKGVNVLYGLNGQGKTNLIEAILVIIHNFRRTRSRYYIFLP